MLQQQMMSLMSLLMSPHSALIWCSKMCCFVCFIFKATALFNVNAYHTLIYWPAWAVAPMNWGSIVSWTCNFQLNGDTFLRLRLARKAEGDAIYFICLLIYALVQGNVLLLLHTAQSLRAFATCWSLEWQCWHHRALMTRDEECSTFDLWR